MMSNHLCMVYFCMALLAQINKGNSAGTTLNLKKIVLGRCWYYKQFKMQPATQKATNCTELLETFTASFAFKDPCKLTFSDYKPFFELLTASNIVNKSLFWSGTYKAVHSYSDFDLRYTTLEDTLEGYMMNELLWCGNPLLSKNTSDGIDYTSCPNSSSCNLFTPYWGQASQKFAERARGIVRVMVNGSRVTNKGDPIPAYSRSSFFGKYELPSFDVSSITRLIIIVVHTIGGKEREKCHTESIKLLEQDAYLRGLKVDCYDDPDAVRHILCADHPAATRCLFQDEHQNKGEDSEWKPVGIALAVTSSVLLIVVIGMATTFCCMIRRKNTVVIC